MKSPSVLVLLGHGSKSLKTRDEMEELAAKLQAASPGLQVMAAFLTLLEPDLPRTVATAVQAGAEEIHVLPLFFFSGKHVLEDIPALVADLRSQYPRLRLTLREPLGHHPGFFDLLRQAGGFA
ncbi:MAG: CbiX/SirB N-terminal domain-containing protein [Fibrobacteria bacterium]